MTTIMGLSDDDGKMTIADTLRLFVGLGRRISWSDLATATGDDERKLRSYVEKDPPAMPAPVMMRVFAVLPPEAWGRINARMGYGAPPPLDANRGVAMRRMLAKVSRLVAQGNEYLEDDIITPREEAEFSRSVEDVMPDLVAHIIHRD